MTTRLRRYAVPALALAASVIATAPVRADALSEMNRFWQGAAVNTTGPTAFGRRQRPGCGTLPR